MRPNSLDRTRGCLLAGAKGDALGAPVEFLSPEAIRARFGPAGTRDLALAYGRIGAITDDTQMTLFTAGGLLAHHLDRARGGNATLAEVMHQAYLRWLATQGETPMAGRGAPDRTSWLDSHAELHARRAPGTTVLAALASGRAGTPGKPLNDSKGCGSSSCARWWSKWPGTCTPHSEQADPG
jgi:ADP-ribosyl-[dinitrogen reductase] hydrolase